MMLAIYIVATVVGVVVGWLLRDRRKEPVSPVVEIPVAQAAVAPVVVAQEPRRERVRPGHREARRRQAYARWRGERDDAGVEG